MEKIFTERTFTVCIPLIACSYQKVLAVDEDEAFEKVIKQIDEDKVDFDGLSPEESDKWWVMEGDYI